MQRINNKFILWNMVELQVFSQNDLEFCKWFATRHIVFWKLIHTRMLTLFIWKKYEEENAFQSLDLQEDSIKT